MKTYLLTLSLAMGLLPLATAASLSFPDSPTAKQQAKAEGKPTLILWHGSNWMSGTDELYGEWQKLAGSAESPLPLVIGQFDEVVGLSNEDRNKAGMPFSEFNLPVAVLFAPDGTYMASYRGQTVRSATTLATAVQQTLTKLPEFTELVKKARSTQGRESATAAGKALSLLAPADACRHPELTKIINERDPKDVTGYRTAFCYEHMGMFKLINDVLKGGPDGKLSGKDRKFDEAEKYVQSILSRKEGSQAALGADKQQQWLAGLYHVQKERMCSTGSKDRSQVLATLQRIIDINPDSEYGQGATAYHRYWNPDSFFQIDDYFYDASNQSHGFEKDWHVDVTEKVTKPGTYTFTLKPYVDGGMITRNFRLAINGKEVSRAKEDPAENTRTAEITVPRVPKGAKIEVWLTASCHDHWLNCSGSIDMVPSHKKADKPEKAEAGTAAANQDKAKAVKNPRKPSSWKSARERAEERAEKRRK